MNLPRGYAGFSIVLIMSNSPFHRRSPDHALGSVPQLTEHRIRTDVAFATQPGFMGCPKSMLTTQRYRSRILRSLGE